MQPDCKKVIAHVSRLQGQLETLKNYLDSGKSCDEVVHIMLSATKSFDSLKAKVVESYLHVELCKSDKACVKDIEQLLSNLSKIIKA